MTKRPEPLWEPDPVEDAATIANRLREYTNGARAFVVYQFGTGVFSDSANPRSDADYSATLSHAVDVAPDFTVVAMQDRNFLVRFASTVCGIVMREHFERYRSAIQTLAVTRGLLPGEKLMAPEDESTPVEHYYIGMYARAKLYRDAMDLAIASRYPTSAR